MNDRECQNCAFQHSCRETFAVATQFSPPQPFQQPYQQPYAVAPPPPPAYASWRSPQPSVWQQAQQPVQMQRYAPQHQALSLAPQHMGPIQDYGSLFGQYPNEGSAERLGKNMALRALEAIFNELTRFFHYWTWPSA